MSNFKNFKLGLQKQLETMIQGGSKLFLTDIEKDLLWESYLDAYPAGTNEVYKERREYDCNSCRQFIRPFGNLVSIVDNKLISIWDIEGLEFPYNEVAKKLSSLVKSRPIKDVFITKEPKLGVDKNKQLLENGEVLSWEHFYFNLPKEYVDKSSKSIEYIQGSIRDRKNVFKRSMDELTLEAGKTILELIDQGSLYRGEEHRSNIEKFISYKVHYNKLLEADKNNWCWSNTFDNRVAKIRNTALGTLLIDLSNEVDLDVAVTKFEKVMAPTNYKRPKAIFTKRMVQEAEDKIKELGLENSLSRRFAVLEDITVNNVLFVNRDAKKKLKGSVFDELKENVSENPKKFNKVEEVGIDDFINDILPKANNVEVFMENKHQSNLMSLISPEDKEAKSILKWNNNFSWSYNGDITDSIKQNVKNAGGNVDGVLRFSIRWNEDGNNEDDLDAHCIEPNGNHIEFGTKGRIHPSTGMLDIDVINPNGKTAVENITWTNKNKMQEGKYKLFVNNYSHRGGKGGFRAEIEYDGQIYSYDYTKHIRVKENVLVAEIEFSRINGIKFINSLDSTSSSKEIWNVKTNKFCKVSTFMLSPNYWDDQKSIGNKHYFFFLEGCKTDTSPRGFYNEFLNDNLITHKRVFEALGSKMRVEASDEQLSGLGFSSTQRNHLIVKVEGTFSRIIKIIF